MSKMREPKWMRELKKLTDAIRAQQMAHTHQQVGYVEGCPACEAEKLRKLTP